jgi:uncharacterized SAM-binding protein YcdF (DUF218 family)
MYELARLAGQLVTPLSIAFGLWGLAALFGLLRRRRAALISAAVAVAWLWLASTPFFAQVLVNALQREHPMLAAQEAPAADAIVVLGGAVGGVAPQRPGIVLTAAASRVWHAAALYRAGKAKWVVVAAGGDPEPGEQVEADAIAGLLVSLGVPDSAIRRESASRSTLQNALYSRPILEALGARRVLLVTSGDHMARAARTFQYAWDKSTLVAMPSPSDRISYVESGWKLWFPTVFALGNVTKALKEFSGMAVLVMMSA